MTRVCLKRNVKCAFVIAFVVRKSYHVWKHFFGMDVVVCDCDAFFFFSLVINKLYYYMMQITSFFQYNPTHTQVLNSFHLTS